MKSYFFITSLFCFFGSLSVQAAERLSNEQWYRFWFISSFATQTSARAVYAEAFLESKKVQEACLVMASMVAEADRADESAQFVIEHYRKDNAAFSLKDRTRELFSLTNKAVSFCGSGYRYGHVDQKPKNADEVRRLLKQISPLAKEVATVADNFRR
ncbi:MAG: hypothetical protein AB7G93_08925 [Bdellovibrionales bacterium]